MDTKSKILHWMTPDRTRLDSVIVSGNFHSFAKLGHQGRGVCHNSTIKNSGPKIAGRRSM